MKTTLILYFNSMSGIFTSILDLFNNITKYKSIKFIIFYSDFYKIIKFKKYFVNIKNIEFINIDKVNNIQFEQVILSVNTYKFIKDKISFDEIILLDSSTLFKDSLSNSELINTIINIQNKKILGNEFNKNFFSSDFYLYYHKFNSNRLNSLKNIEEKYNILTYQTYKNTEKKDISPFSYKTYIYERWSSINNIYYENIGKLIFEFKYLDKKVFYKSKNKCMNDGLTYYLKLFDIDDNTDQEIIIQKDDIVKKLFFNEDDLILQLIK